MSDAGELPSTPRALPLTPRGAAMATPRSTSAQDIHEDATVCKDTILTGPHNLTVGPHVRLHPYSCLHASTGAVSLEASCVVEERAVVRNISAEGHEMVVGPCTVVGVGAVVEAARVGRGCVIGAKAVVGPAVVIGDGCVVGPCVTVPTGSVLEPGSVWVLTPGPAPGSSAVLKRSQPSALERNVDRAEAYSASLKAVLH